jgi:hypothetical protein
MSAFVHASVGEILERLRAVARVVAVEVEQRRVAPAEHGLRAREFGTGA